MRSTAAPRSGAAFDGAAAEYDELFTNTALGRVLRSTVRGHLAAALAPRCRILELGCGTGEDAVWLADRGHRVFATDASSKMLETARAKAVAAGVDASVTFHPLDLNAISEEGEAPPGAPFESVLANFGVLNCVEDRRRLARSLAHWLCPGATVAVVVMGPICAWEIVWFALHLRPLTALRRLRAGRQVEVAHDHVLPVWYPSPARLRRDFAPWFSPRRSAAIGALLPPPYLDHLVRDRPRLLARMAAVEQRLPSCMTWLADHYLICFERRRSLD